MFDTGYEKLKVDKLQKYLNTILLSLDGYDNIFVLVFLLFKPIWFAPYCYALPANCFSQFPPNV